MRVQLEPPAGATWERRVMRLGDRMVEVQQVVLEDALAASVLGDASPWWAHVWPAGIRLAELVVAGPRLDGLRCLDLGTGTGAVGIAAGLMGAHVTFADAMPAALALAAHNAREAGLRDVEVLQLDWRRPPARRFQRIFAADVIYDAAHSVEVPRAVAALLEHDGEAMLLDAGRQPVGRLLEAAAEAGLRAVAEPDRDGMFLVRLTPAAAASR